MRRNLGLKFETMSSFGDSYACNRNSSTPPSFDTYIGRMFEAIKRCHTCFGSQVPAHFLLKFPPFHRDLAAQDVLIA